MKKLFLLLIINLLLFSCARVGNPNGGKRDSLAPKFLSSNIDTTRVNVSRNLKELGQLERAKKLVNESLEIFKSNRKFNQGDYADALRLLGDIYEAEGKINKAIAFNIKIMMSENVT